MNKTKLPRTPSCLAALALTLGAAQASAQSVTIFGLIDVGIESISNVGVNGNTLTRMPSNTASTPSRLGFRGTEDLGNGLKAGFVLESGIATDTGGLNHGGRLFGRQSYVSLSSNDWGEVGLGRQYTMNFWALLSADVIGASAHGLASLDSYLPNSRADNAISYRLKKGGWNLGATYSTGRDTATAGNPGATNCAGESSTDTMACREWSAMAKYDSDTWGLAWSQDVIRGGSGAIFGLGASDLTDTRSNFNGWVKFGDVKVGGGLLRRHNDGNSATPISNLYYLGLTVPVLPAVVIDAQAAVLDYKDSANQAKQLVVRGTYNFSKRTAAYLSLARLDNSGTLAVSVSNGAAGGLPTAGGGQTGIMMGLKHSF